MLCGSLCQSCEASNENQLNQSHDVGGLEQLMAKEIFEREKIGKIIDKEINNLRTNIHISLQTIKEQCSAEKFTLQDAISKVENETNKTITKIEYHIEKIKDNHLNHIEKDISSINTKLDGTHEDINEIKDTLKDLNKLVIKNSTQLELLKK